MIQNRYCVVDDESDEWSWHYTLDRAITVADTLAAREGREFRVDFNAVEITRDGVNPDPVESEPDLYSTSKGR